MDTVIYEAKFAESRFRIHLDIILQYIILVYNILQYNTKQYNTIQYSNVQYNHNNTLH